MVKKVLIIR